MMRYCDLHTEASFYHQIFDKSQTYHTFRCFGCKWPRVHQSGKYRSKLRDRRGRVLCKSERVHVLLTDNGHQCTNLGLSRESGDKMKSGWVGRWRNEHQSDMLMLPHKSKASLLYIRFTFSTTKPQNNNFQQIWWLQILLILRLIWCDVSIRVTC